MSQEKPSLSLSSSRNNALGDDGRFHCQFCGLSYRNYKHLKRHITRHVGQTSYVCKLCGSDFSRRDSMTRHEMRCRKRADTHGSDPYSLSHHDGARKRGLPARSVRDVDSSTHDNHFSSIPGAKGTADPAMDPSPKHRDPEAALFSSTGVLYSKNPRGNDPEKVIDTDNMDPLSYSATELPYENAWQPPQSNAVPLGPATYPTSIRQQASTLYRSSQHTEIDMPSEIGYLAFPEQLSQKTPAEVSRTLANLYRRSSETQQDDDGSEYTSGTSI